MVIPIGRLRLMRTKRRTVLAVIAPEVQVVAGSKQKNKRSSTEIISMNHDMEKF